jgi:hypothetical protein
MNAQARHVLRSEQNRHLPGAATSTKTRFCRAIWLRFMCVHASSYVCMSFYSHMYVCVTYTNNFLAGKRVSCDIEKISKNLCDDGCGIPAFLNTEPLQGFGLCWMGYQTCSRGHTSFDVVYCCFNPCCASCVCCKFML